MTESARYSARAPRCSCLLQQTGSRGAKAFTVKPEDSETIAA